MDWFRKHGLALLIGFAAGFGPFLAYVSDRAYSSGYDAGVTVGEGRFVETFCSVEELRQARPSICE